MIIRCLPRPAVPCFISTNSSFSSLRLRPILLTRGAAGKFRNTFGIQLNSRSISASLRSSAAKQLDNVLSGKEDDHGGVIVELSTEPMDPILFTRLLKASIIQWKQQGKKGVWLKLPIELANLIETAVNEGFYYHHAEKNYLMLVHWIPATPNTLPPNASHRVGVGAFVMKENGEVLVVQEKGGKMKGTGVWKFPTGVVDEGEDICDAAVREVKEETGIDAEFVEILAFRQSHKKFFGKSDLFFMCMLQPFSFEIQKQEREIEAAQWMTFEEYAAQPFVKKYDLPKYVAQICYAKRQNHYSGFSPVSTIPTFSKQQTNLYFNTNDLNVS
ncbi:hypothetical protein L2E82_41120 [Cichorium intybus]|uniref:Uncharacterized protein n=1 Tax=Cichorium intybus TaxID=13427 RepID=A0ACB9AMX8_CICIN|nr:hypothetical protein L2E82_41120 [Cichorium intybus]